VAKTPPARAREVKPGIVARVRQSKLDALIVGDVANVYLTYVPAILAEWPTARFLCLQRNRADTVRSMLAHVGDRNPWQKHDGRPLLVEGRLQFASWEGKDGRKRSKLRIIVENFQFLGDGQGAGAGGHERTPQTTTAPQSPTPTPDDAAEPPPPEPDDQDGDRIPF